MGNERIYVVEDGENAVDVSDIQSEEQAIAVFTIKAEDRHYVTKQADLEGYVLYNEEGQLKVYPLIGFVEDSKVVKDSYYDLKEEPYLRNVLLRFCDATNPKTKEPMTTEELEEVFNG